ncbi:MAG: hypothetical protein WCX86_02985 [Candidatus Hydrogenedentales bacterium]|jgi:hypothetical protein
MNKAIGYILLVVLVLAAAIPLYRYLTKERVYYTEIEGIVELHSNKWDHETLSFYFQYPHYVEQHFLAYPDTATGAETTVNFEDGCTFVGAAQVSPQNITLYGNYMQPTGALWKYQLTRSLNLGGLVGVSGTAELTMPFTMNNCNYTVNIVWVRPSGVKVFLDDGVNPKTELKKPLL